MWRITPIWSLFDMKIYGASLLALNSKGINHRAIVFIEETKNKAMQVASEQCYILYPTQKGYTNHDVTVVEMPDNIATVD